MRFWKSEGTPPDLVEHRRLPDTRTAIVFIHGFQGNAAKTFGRFPEYLVEEPRIDGWNVLSLGYATSLRLEVRGLWKTSSPPLERLAQLLVTEAMHGALEPYESLVLIAHSMGGLVVQQALVSDMELRSRCDSVILFGTPSDGLEKAGLASVWNRQLKAMAKDGAFIRGLRSSWRKVIGDQPDFKFRTVAGSEDEFVPSSSSLSPFPIEQQAVVRGGHLEIVKPQSAGELSVALVVDIIDPDKADPHGPWSSAQLALERRDFKKVISNLMPAKDDLDQDSKVVLAIALAETNRADEAIELLQDARENGETDAMGVLAGRHKRLWLATGSKTHAESALKLYSDALEIALEAGDGPQIYYLAINMSFLELVFRKDRSAAMTTANLAALHASSDQSYWAVATQAEACLIQGDLGRARVRFRQAAAMSPTPRQLRSSFDQLTRIAITIGEPAFAERLEQSVSDLIV